MSHPSAVSPARARTERLQQRAFDFARQVLDRCPRHFADDPGRVVWRQLIRAAPSMAANLIEADEASSDAEFIFRMKLALREAKEAHMFLRLIAACRLAGHDSLSGLEDEARQLSAIFATIVVRVKRRVAADRDRRPR